MEVYLIILAAIIILGLLMPQRGPARKSYILCMAVLHTFICGFRYMHLTGDLIKYHNEFNMMDNYSWFSENVLHKGRNAGFYLLMKLVNHLSDANFQLFLLIIALIIEIIVAVMIYRYSPMPWFSYLVWNCVGFYVFGFSSLKQALAMAILMCAMMCIFEQKPKGFVIYVLLAGLIHLPALAFLPAYWLAKCRVNLKTIMGYIFAGIAMFVLRKPFVSFISGLYYEKEEFELYSESLGGRFFLIVLLLLCGILLKGFKNKQFQALFNMLFVAALFQMLAGFDNVFTRWADYYLQFAVLYIPMLFYETQVETPQNISYLDAVLPFNRRSLQFFTVLVVLALILFYYYTCIGVEIAVAVDDYTNFRFMWEV